MPPSAIKKLQEQFKIEMTYNSNAIEGSSLTLRETFLVINEGITVKNKPLRDHLEAKDHYEALEYLYGLVEKDRPQTVSEQTIRSLHKIVVLETEKEWAGKYRNAGVLIAGADHQPPEAIRVPSLMEELINWFRKNQKKLHPVELSALFHHQLVYIHPFFDGNGRTARLVMNLLLMSRDYPLVIVLKNDRRRYYETLKKADRNDFFPFINFIGQAVERTLDIYLKIISPSPEKFRRFSIIYKQTPYCAKYLNLLARSGKLEAHKEGRNWVTSPEAVQRYQDQRLRKRKVKVIK